VQEALAAVLSAAAGHASPRDVPLHGALGLVLAEDVCAPDPLPPFRASVKVPQPPLPASLSPFPPRRGLTKPAPVFLFSQDGYAVVASDGPGECPVVTESRAGNDGLGVVVVPGTVAYVTTGGEVLAFFPPAPCDDRGCADYLTVRADWQGRSPTARTPWCRWRTPSASPPQRMGRGGLGFWHGPPRGRIYATW
jgi:hypothetical protein